MIQYEAFYFAAPPRTASAWFVRAAQLVGLHAKEGNRHQPPPSDQNVFTVSFVRHPVDWLVSYYNTIHGGICGLPAVDVFAPLANRATTVVEFLQLCARQPGIVGSMFESYRANTVMKVEDLPHGAVEFFQSVGVRPEVAATAGRLTPMNCCRKMPYVIGPSVRKQVVQAERAFCEAFEYF